MCYGQSMDAHCDLAGCAAGLAQRFVLPHRGGNFVAVRSLCASGQLQGDAYRLPRTQGSAVCGVSDHDTSPPVVLPLRTGILGATAARPIGSRPHRAGDRQSKSRRRRRARFDVHGIGQSPQGPRRIDPDFYLGERDLFGIGFSDNVVFRKQYYARAVFDDVSNLKTLRELVLHSGEDFSDPAQAKTMRQTNASTWNFDVTGTGFDATFGLTFSAI